MRPAIYPLTLYRGDTYSWSFMLWQDQAKTVPLDLTGASAKAEIRNVPGGDLIIELDCAVTLPNIVEVFLYVEAWEGWTLKKASWDLQLTFDGTPVVVFTPIAGPVAVAMDVTDSTSVGAP